MATAAPTYAACPSEERVEWVLMPVRVPASYSPTSSPMHAQPFYPTFLPSSHEVSYPATWDQRHAVPAFPMSEGENVLCEPQFDMDFTLMLDAAIHPDLSALPTHPTHEASFTAVPTPVSEFLPETTSPAAMFMDGAFAGDIWSGDSQSASGSSVGSPGMYSPPGATESTSTPCSTPPTPPTPLDGFQLHFCSVEPTCFETFSREADLKRHERKHKVQRKQNFCCPICRKPHLDKRALDRHLWSRHEDYAARVGAKSEKTKCRVCEYVSRADNVRRHERSQHSISKAGASRR